MEPYQNCEGNPREYGLQIVSTEVLRACALSVNLVNQY